MEEMVNAKYDPGEAFREILDEKEQSTLFSKSIQDDFLGKGVNKVGKQQTNHKKQHGQDKSIVKSSVRDGHHGDPSLFQGINKQPSSVIFQTYSEIREKS